MGVPRTTCGLGFSLAAFTWRRVFAKNPSCCLGPCTLYVALVIQFSHCLFSQSSNCVFSGCGGLFAYNCSSLILNPTKEDEPYGIGLILLMASVVVPRTCFSDPHNPR